MLDLIFEASNVTKESNDSLTIDETIESGNCFQASPQHLLFQLANVCFIVSYLSPSCKYGILLMHSLLIFGFLLFATWAWNVVCAPGVFSWNFSYMIINMGQTLYILYSMRDVRFPCKDLEDIYETLFEPMKISRILFKRLISPDVAQILVLNVGEAYAMQNITRTDRLGLLMSGKANVISGNHYLHSIEPRQFLDSPEFECSKLGMEEKFKVSIIAATPCMYICWSRHALEYMLIKETYLASALSLILARDITDKLYAMNEKIVTEHGNHLDIRLPSVTTSLCNSHSSLASGDQKNSVSASPSKLQTLGLRIKDRNIAHLLSAKRNTRSKSLQTNSLGAPVLASPRIAARNNTKLSIQYEGSIDLSPYANTNGRKLMYKM